MLTHLSHRCITKSTVYFFFVVTFFCREVQTQPALSASDLSSQLHATFSNQTPPKRNIQFSEPTDDDLPQDDEDMQCEQDKQKNFVQKRKNHYNEYLMVQKMKQKTQQDDDSDDSDTMQE